MEKTITTSGCSLALVIDQPIARMLSLVYGSRVKVMIDAGSLIVTPTSVIENTTTKPPARTATEPSPTQGPTRMTEREVLMLIRELDAYGMPDEEFRRISNGERMTL